MFDNLFNLIIILIPLAIFIGRAVVRARGRHAPPPKPPPPAPVQIDEYEDDYDVTHWERASEHIKRPLATQGTTRVQTAPTIAPPLLTGFQDQPLSIQKPLVSVDPKVSVKSTVAPEQKGFPNLSYLSPLRQAVVMAEILGPPKALK